MLCIHIATVNVTRGIRSESREPWASNLYPLGITASSPYYCPLFWYLDSARSTRILITLKTLTLLKLGISHA